MSYLVSPENRVWGKVFCTTIFTRKFNSGSRNKEKRRWGRWSQYTIFKVVSWKHSPRRLMNCHGTVNHVEEGGMNVPSSYSFFQIHSLSTGQLLPCTHGSMSRSYSEPRVLHKARGAVLAWTNCVNLSLRKSVGFRQSWLWQQSQIRKKAIGEYDFNYGMK